LHLRFCCKQKTQINKAGYFSTYIIIFITELPDKFRRNIISFIDILVETTTCSYKISLLPVYLHCIVLCCTFKPMGGSSWSWSYGNWIYNYLCNQCLSPHDVVISNPVQARCTSLSMTCDRSAWFLPGPFSFLLQWNWPSRCSWNIVESGVKHHQSNKQTVKLFGVKLCLGQ
jgi:hypothetical protein